MYEEINYTNAALYIMWSNANCQALIACTPLQTRAAERLSPAGFPLGS